MEKRRPRRRAGKTDGLCLGAGGRSATSPPKRREITRLKLRFSLATMMLGQKCAPRGSEPAFPWMIGPNAER